MTTMLYPFSYSSLACSKLPATVARNLSDLSTTASTLRIASCTSLSACLPLYCSADGKEALIQNLRDPAYRQVVKGQMDGDDPAFDGRYRQCGGFENIMIGIAPHTREAEGLTVAEIARQQGKADFDAFFDLLVDNELGCFAIYFSMCDEDLFRIIQHPRCMVGTDGVVSSTAPPIPGAGPPSPGPFICSSGRTICSLWSR